MLPGTRARSFAPGFVNTTSRLSRRALACVSCPSCCRLKVQQSNPVWMNEDARHTRIERCRLIEQSLSLFLAHRPADHCDVLRCDALDGINPHRPANEEDLGGRKVTVDTHSHL